jgi:hypothetical protein
MSGAAPTPGPWLAVFMPDGEGGDYFDGFVRPLPNGRCEDVDIERRANAALVAAAPEMLEALKQLVDVVGGSFNAVQQARAAIAKAEGRA